MPSVGRVYLDQAGGRVMTGSSSVLVDNLPIVRLGSLIEDHGRFEHDSAKMIVGFNGVLIEDLPVCTAGMAASCGHRLISSSSVEAG
jgi:uncharacterized Zn-binding protein involved in type VI secretion